MIPEKIKTILKKQHYGIVGRHSAVQICKWTKSSLNNKGACWKEKFYGISSHRCCQFSPAVMWCENKCIHCWRPIEMNLGTKLKKIDESKEILDGIIKTRKKLLIGFKGNKNTSKKKFKEALEPTLFTLFLSGEPTLYPRLDELIREIRKRKAISFLVSNGQNPKVIKKLEKNKALPTQLTISLNAPNEKLFRIWHNSERKDAWKRFNETLKLMKKLKGKTRRVIRLTLVKKGDEKEKIKLSNMKNEHIKQYARLIRIAEPDFIHVKGFKSLGYSRERLGYSKQPFHEEIKDFAERLKEQLKKDGSKKTKFFGATKSNAVPTHRSGGEDFVVYKILGEVEISCVVLLGKDKKKMKIRKGEI